MNQMISLLAFLPSMSKVLWDFPEKASPTTTVIQATAMAGTATVRAAAVDSAPNAAPRRTDASRAVHRDDDCWHLYQEKMRFSKFHIQHRRTTFTIRKRSTHVLLRLITLRRTVHDDDDDGCGDEDSCALP